MIPTGILTDGMRTKNGSLHGFQGASTVRNAYRTKIAMNLKTALFVPIALMNISANTTSEKLKIL